MLPGNDGFPSFPMGHIPVNGLAQTIGKLGLRQPAQLPGNLGGVDRIAQISTLSVGNVSDELLFDSC